MTAVNSELINIIRENSLVEYDEQDNYINMILKNFNSNDEEIFLINFYLYQKFNKFTDYIVDLEKIYRWIGFSTFGNAKKTLIKHFTRDSDYKISLLSSHKQSLEKECRGGQNKENIMMNVHTFKKFCLKSQTANASKIHDYYIKLEDVICDYITSSQTKLKQKHKLETEALKEKHIKALTKISNLKQEKDELHMVKNSEEYIKINDNLEKETCFTKNIDELVVELNKYKGGLKKFIVKHFKDNIDYKIINECQKKDNRRGGQNKESILLTDKAYELVESNYGSKYRYITRIGDTEVVNSLLMSLENSSIGFLEECFKNVLNIQREYRVKNYRIDLYIIDYKIAIECDEHNHQGYSYNKEMERMYCIQKELGCKIIRFDPSSKNFKIYDIINYIFKQVVLKKDEDT